MKREKSLHMEESGWLDESDTSLSPRRAEFMKPGVITDLFLTCPGD